MDLIILDRNTFSDITDTFKEKNLGGGYQNASNFKFECFASQIWLGENTVKVEFFCTYHYMICLSRILIALKFRPQSWTGISAKFWILFRDAFFNIHFSKLVCAEISQMAGASNRVIHQTVNAHNSVLSKEIHDQGKIIKCLLL